MHWRSFEIQSDMFVGSCGAEGYGQQMGSSADPRAGQGRPEGNCMDEVSKQTCFPAPVSPWVLLYD